MTITTLCLAVAIYYESRNQPTAGQFAVAHVILNRMASPRYPATACNVIYQDGQFSFVLDGSRSTFNDPQAWGKALRIAKAAQLVPDTTRGATHYHASGSRGAYWKRHDRLVARIGDHLFYRLRRGE